MVSGSSGFVSKFLKGHEYLVANCVLTDNRTSEQMILGVVIDIDTGWTKSLHEQDYRAFLNSGNRKYLGVPDLDPN